MLALTMTTAKSVCKVQPTNAWLSVLGRTFVNYLCHHFFHFSKRSKTHNFQIYIKCKLFKRHLCTNSSQRTAVVLLTSVFAESLVDLQLWVSP